MNANECEEKRKVSKPPPLYLEVEENCKRNSKIDYNNNTIRFYFIKIFIKNIFS